jgi:signal transduction histidine kinase
MVLTVVATLGGLLVRWRHRRARRKRQQLRMLSKVTHELRTPLNAIIGWVHLLKRGTLDADHARRALDSIERNARLEARLVDAMLDATAAAKGEPPVARAGAVVRVSAA